MAISYPLSLPSSKTPVTSTWYLESAVGKLESEFTFAQQIQEHQGERWQIEATFPIMKPLDAGYFRAFMAMLRGSKGTFLFGDVTRALPLGAISGTVLVNGAGATGNTLPVKGLAVSTTGVLLAGDWIQLGSGATSKLHMVTVDANSDGSGHASLTVVPELRSSPADNAPVTYQNCKAVFRATQNLIPVFSTTGVDLTAGLKLTAVEVLP